MKGCGISILVAALIGAMLIIWLLVERKNIQKKELPDIEFKTRNFLAYFNSETFDEIDKMFGLALIKIYEKNKRLQLIGDAKKLVGGKVTIVKLINWKLNQIAGQKFILISYACNSEKGETKMTIKYNWENEWKIEAFEFKMKN